MQADLFLVGFVCGFGSCGDLLIETLRPRAHRDAPLRVKQRTREPSRRTISR
jgi:hypothetical protein